MAGQVGELFSPIDLTTRSLRDISPAHYIFKTDSFSALSKDKYESNVFKASGYQWKLCLYPRGNKSRGVTDHISLYMEIVNTDKLRRDWEVNVKLTLFVFDHNCDKYLAIEDVGQVRRFHNMKTVWGFDQLLSLDTFKDPSNGYLVDDCCVFGAEVFVIQNEGQGECLSMKTEAQNHTYTFSLHKYSGHSPTLFQPFKITNYNWNAVVYPNGFGTSVGNYLSFYLKICGSSNFPKNWKMDAQFTLRIKDQVFRKNDFERPVRSCFSAKNKMWGFHNFLLLSTVRDPAKGYLMGRSLSLEIHIESAVLTVAKNLN